jgi:hypothetical protein
VHDRRGAVLREDGVELLPVGEVDDFERHAHGLLVPGREVVEHDDRDAAGLEEADGVAADVAGAPDDEDRSLQSV